jgi:RNA polymerase sigma-70 factor (ECF subfamily)
MRSQKSSAAPTHGYAASVESNVPGGCVSAASASRLDDERAELPLPPEFEQVFREFAPYVLRVLPRLGVAARDCEDVAQDVFLAVHRGLPTFERRSSLKTWVYGICIRTASNYRDRAHRRHERLHGEVHERIETLTPARALDNQRALERLDAALSRLTQPQRCVFVLHAIEGLGVREIAEALGCSKFTVYARLYAAQAHVRQALAQERI